MPIQVFVDDSGGKGHTRHFVLAALAGHSDSWKQFSLEWRVCLAEYPSIRSLKMQQAAACTGQFRGMTYEQRDHKLRCLAQIINRHAKLMTCSVIDLEAHKLTWGNLPKPHSEPYFYPFHNSITAMCFSLWDQGWREKFEIIFDDQVIFGPRAKRWYPIIIEILAHREAEAASILPVDPIFRSDDDLLPIQAADLFAWVIRKKHDDPKYDKFDWLLNEELMNVEMSEYVQYYNEERMTSVMKDAQQVLREDSIPSKVKKVSASILAR